MSSGNAGALRRRVLLSGTMLVAAVAGYGRRACGACLNPVGSTFQCSGAEVTTQNITANNAAVSTLPGFSVTTVGGKAITINGDGAQSYTDTNASSLTASAGTALYIRSGGDFAGTPGSVTINTNGALSGYNGIYAISNGAGALTITANSNVTGSTGGGIVAQNNAGTALTVTSGTGTTVSGYYIGIFARNSGTGALTITANGNVTGTVRSGIQASNSANGTDLSVTTAAGTTVRGGTTGIDANNSGTGALTITANGNVYGTSAKGIYARNTGAALSVTTGAGTVRGATTGIDARNSGTGALTITANGNVTGTTGYGIDARNLSATTTDLSVTTAAGTVHGRYAGIRTRNSGTGALTITANGNVTGSFYGIDARNLSATSTALSVTTGAGTTVSGAFGIYARNLGSGALTIAANGNVTGGNYAGIQASNAGSAALSVTTAAGTTVSGAYGIVAANSGTGALTITANGDVTSTGGDGIFAQSGGGALAITVAATGTVTSNGAGTNAFAIETNGATATVTVAGTVNGGAGGAIKFDQTGAFANRLELVTGAVINGNVLGGAGTDTLALTGTGTGSFDAGLIGPGRQYQSFEAFQKDGSGAWTLTGTNTLTLPWTVAQGTLIVNGSLSNAAFTVNAGVLTIAAGGVTSTVTNNAVFNNAGTVSGNLINNAGTTTNSGAITGNATVNGGLVNVSGSIAGQTLVTGGVLAGTGTVGNTLVTGGIFAPGSGTPGSSMTVGGTLGFNAASTYAININPTTSSFANVSGAATLGGATVNAIFAPGSYIAKQYTILNAGSIIGTFGMITNTNLPANFTDALSYDATHAYLNLTLAFIAPPTSGLSGNQNKVANALINYFNTNGGIPLVFGGLTANGLSQASGQPGASTSQAGITGVGQFINGVFDGAFGDNPGRSGATAFAPQDDEANAYVPKRQVSREAKEAYAAVTPRDRRPSSFEQRWNVWAMAYGGNSRVNGDTTAGTNTTTNRIFGTVAGALYHFTPDTQAGFALGGAGSSFDIANGFGGGRADAFNAAAYAKHTWGAAYVAGLLGYSWQDTSTDRTVTIAGIDRLHASFRAQALAARLEGGWRYATPMVGITPYAALQTTTFYLPGYGETATSGSNTFALNYTSKTVTATRSEFGAKFDNAMLVQGGVFTLKAKAAWAHDWNTDRSAIAIFQTLPGATFAVNGAQPAANAALASLGAEMKWHNGWSTAGYFEGEFSRATTGYAAKGSVKYAW
ncbi:autotransporter domain-containing protein [Afipia sp. GAS231]|uniref:autotransporter domain-containing protein n=1 Tax=Afipia sp. GAS231 TaxID=1882747 RepID=UPI00087D44AE|nr:autotransporter domain-containing protein [Afipia sp. GAS231]SDN04826.1 Uncharacterized conserved protein, contains a C-terminal beta-barrel porin domain [Afipia sp. GAS231]